MLSKSFQSCTPSPYGSLAGLRRTEHCAPLTRHGLAFSQPSKDFATPPAWGESADDYVECIHCISLWLLAKVADFGFWQSRPPSAGDLKVGGADCTVPRTG